MKYKGQLNKPIVRKRMGLLATDEQLGEAASKSFNDMVQKLPLLADAHGVAEGDWFGLAFELARAHVPGFKVVEPAGRPTEWSELDKAELRTDADDLIAARGVTRVTDAIGRVCKLERWAEKTKGMKVSALSKHYYDADARWVRVVRDARAWNQLSSGIDSRE
ncbi:MAG: hypothetical protein WBP25_10150 [Giesbergeria sp.]|nr:hypothetical protein [Giesbergeria sp.]MBP7083364.1 hypothetical protein [Giesbergeria sp.]